VSLAGPVAVLLVMAAGFAVALRRRHPVVMLGVLLVGSFLISTLTVPNASALIYFLPVAYVLYLVAATYETKRDAVRVLLAVYVTLVAVAIVLMSGQGGPFNGSPLIPVVLCVIIAWGSGYSVRQRRRYAVRLQDEAASKAVAQERLRIARELHDVVAHSMSVIAVQAGYGQYVIDSQPGDARDALGAIQATSREALDEMRRMLGALRQADDAGIGDQLQPQPDGELGAGLAGIGVARRAVGRAFETRIAETAIAAVGQHDALAEFSKIREQCLAIFFVNLGADRHFEHDVGAGSAVAILAHAAAAVLRREMLLVAVVDQGVEPIDRLHHHVAAIAAVAAVRPAIFDEFLAAERHAAVAAVAGADIDLGFVEKFH